MPLTASQRSFNGLIFGDSQDEIQVVTESGLDTVAVRSATAPLPRYHGGIPGDHTADTKLINLELWWTGDTPADAETLARSVRAAFQPSRDAQLPYGFLHRSGSEGFVYARCTRRTQPRSQDTEAVGLFRMFIELEVTDPAVYLAAIAATLTPFTSPGGFTWDAVWPISWGAGGGGGGITVTNEGNWETWPTFTIHGPSSGTMTNPRIENVTDGVALVFNANGGVSILPGQQLVVNTHPADRYARFTTGASRYGKLSTDSEFFPLQPGDTELRFRASGDTADAAVAVAGYSADL